MKNKVDILMHPVRIKISQALMRNKDKETGLSPREMLEIIKDVPQATLYRHIQVLLDAGIIHVVSEKKIRSVSEKYYALNAEEARLSSEDWRKASLDDKINYYNYYQLSLLNQYKTYLTNLEEENSADRSTFSIVEMALTNEEFEDFQVELNNLMMKYYNDTSKNKEKDAPIRTIGVTIIPDS
jgi:DNA-binding transcriptional ArsR family regulator